MTRNEVVTLLEHLIGAYPEAFIKDPKATTNIWCLNFAEDEAEKVFKAARLYMRKGTKFPTPADIRKLMNKTFVYDIPQKEVEAPQIASDNELDNELSELDTIMKQLSQDSMSEARTGCDICPFADTDWVDSPNGCHRERCIC